MKNIIFMPFINDVDHGQKWRNDLERDFLAADGSALTREIKTIREKKGDTKTYADEKDYYADLHTKKSERQKMWINCLIEHTAELFRGYLDRQKREDADFTQKTVVCALPEFFWRDINDNDKHTDDINFYHKPLYLETARDILTEDNALMGLTEDYPNMIFFAGTVMWKIINPENHKNEEILNSLIVYAEGKYKETLTKHNVSFIDGFYDANQRLVKNKVGKGGNDGNLVTKFNGLDFTYDICLDFMHRANQNDFNERPRPLSAKFCSKKGISSIDVNVLIAAGMPVNGKYIEENTFSSVFLRCDGLCKPYGQALIRSCGSDGAAVKLIEINPQ
ncbi:MAG: hypothetical protein K2G04_07325 [Oscillospiraceae bacterium]|nr:hypothetical protein [Oscillospiraceae bacterium]